MKKKLLSLALVLVMALTLLPTAAFAEGETLDTQEGTSEIANSGQPDTSGGDQEIDNNQLANVGQPVGDNQPANDGQPVGDNQPAGGEQKDTPVDQPKDTGTQQKCPPHNLTMVPEVKPTCGREGTRQHWTCSGCTILLTTANSNATQGVTEADLVLDKTNRHNWTGKDGSCADCGTRCDHEGDTNKNDAYCSVCGAVIATQLGCGHYTVREKIENQSATCGKNGYEINGGGTAWYCAQCRKYYDSPTSANTVTVKVTLATGEHTQGAFVKTNSSGHTYKCTACGLDYTKSHTYGDDNICDVCGFDRSGSSGGSTTPSPSYRYIDVTSAYVGNYSISVTWTSDLPSGTYFDIYVDGGFQTTVAPSKSSGYFSYTVDFSHYLGDSYYTVAVYARDDHAIYDSVRTYNRYYDHDYWYPDHYYPNSTPSTNSYGIPNASQVNGRYSAAEAIRILRNKNQYNLQNDLMSSSSALDSFERLERAVKDANHVSVNVSSSRSGVPSVFRSGVSITGAAFNASSTNSTVSLVLDAPSVNRYAGRGYQFSMSLTGVGGDSSLDVPVIVSLPLPSDISPNFVKVLHYHNSNTPTVITPQVSGGKIRFPLTGFSDFVVTDGGVPNYTYVSDGYGGYYVPVSTVARQSLVDQHLAAVLPIIAANAANGYIFDDVSGTYWAAPQIAWVKDGGLMTGYYDGTFRPYSGTTRQELWMVLARLAGANPADMWAAREWAMNVGITDGTNPYAPLSNQQMITMLYRYASYRRMNLTAPTTMLSIYHDSASVSPYARTPMAWAINQGIVTGNGTGYLYPQNIATRADFAVYLYRFLQ